MRLPRNISGDDLVKVLSHFGYEVTRQTESHLRLTRKTEDKKFHLTIPNHNIIRVGTLNNILNDLSIHLELEKSKLIEILFQ